MSPSEAIRWLSAGAARACDAIGNRAPRRAWNTRDVEAVHVLERCSVSVDDPTAVARRFHEHYERLAPSFDYETRRESRVPWDDVPLANRRLMVAVVSELLAELRGVPHA